jgi:hypothetical protein
MKIRHVDFYSGSKGDESPRKVYTASGTIIIDRIIETRLEEDFSSKKRVKVFIFQDQENKFYQLKIKQDSFELKQINEKGVILYE